MPRPTSTSRAVISGHLGGGEQFAWGFWLTSSYTSQADTQTAATTIASYFETYAEATLKALLSSDSGYDKVTLYSYAAATGPADYVAEAPITTAVGTSTDASLPLQLACVVTLKTGQAGRRRRGRMYLPVNAKALTAHQFTQAQINAIVADTATFIQNVDNSASISGNVCVMSQVVGEKVSVTELAVDSRLDVQRRRANTEVELYQAVDDIIPS